MPEVDPGPAPWFAPAPAHEHGDTIQLLPPLEGLQSFLEAAERAITSVVSLVDTVARAVKAFFVKAQRAWRQAQRNHTRAARLDAYRRRRHWRTADVRHLVRLGVSGPAQRRIQRMLARKNPGRGVVKKYQPLEEIIMQGLEFFLEFFHPDTPPRRRLALLKRTIWWPYVVESLYRGEHAAAKEARRKSPAMCAEATVAARCLISPATVHKLCEKVRRERRASADAADSQPLRIVDLEIWQQIDGETWPEFSGTGSLDDARARHRPMIESSAD